MKSFAILALALVCTLTLSGCRNFSPRQEQEIDNENGRIDDIENMANSMKNEMGNLETQAEIQNSKLDKIQQGLANFQTNNDNSGVQILSGPGGLIISIVAILSICVITLHYRSVAKINRQTADILAERIASREDPQLEEEVFQAAMHTPAEENMLNIMKKHKKK